MIDEPNVTLPLAISYNERGVTGFTHTVTNSQDQRKQNCFYELSKNPMTGKGTLTLSKRPGVTVDAGTYFSDTTQSVYLTILLDNPAPTVGKGIGTLSPIIITVSTGGNIQAAAGGRADTIVAAGNLLPAYIDKTSLSGTEELVVQLKDSSTGAVQRVFISADAIIWAEITDADFTAIVHRGKMEFMDGFAFIMDGASATSNRIWNSDVNSLTAWTATSFITKQIAQDSPVGLARLSNQILAFGDDTVEMFYNAGNTTGSPLLPIKQLHQRVGLIPPSINSRIFGHYYCTIANRIFFVGRDSGGINAAGVFSYNGQVMERVSTPYIDKILSEVINTSFYSVNTVGHHGQKAVAIALTAPNAASQRWLMFYPDWKEWFEWTSTVFGPINNGEYFLSCGAALKNKLYKFSSSDIWQDNAVSYQWFTQFRLPSNGSSRNFMTMYGVDADTDTSANDLTVEASDDDTASFYTLGTIPLNQNRKIAFRGGSFVGKRHIRLGNTNARPTRIHNFLARING